MLTAKDVYDVVRACLRDQAPEGADEIIKTDLSDRIELGDAVLARCIRGVVVFNREALEANKEKIRAMLDELPDSLSQDGLSFLALCMDKNERLWTGEQMAMDSLCVLAVATNQGHWMPRMVDYRTIRPILPGGMPYFGWTKTENGPQPTSDPNAVVAG